MKIKKGDKVYIIEKIVATNEIFKCKKFYIEKVTKSYYIVNGMKFLKDTLSFKENHLLINFKRFIKFKNVEKEKLDHKKFKLKQKVRKFVNSDIHLLEYKIKRKIYKYYKKLIKEE